MIRKISKSNSDRHYRIANRLGQLITALGIPPYRNFGILMPETAYKMKKKDGKKETRQMSRLYGYQSTITVLGEEHGGEYR